MDRYCARHEIVDFEEFELIISALDNLWLDLVFKHQAQEIKKMQQKAKGQATQSRGIRG